MSQRSIRIPETGNLSIPRFIPSGPPGVSAAVALALTRAVLLIRLAVCLACAGAGLALQGVAGVDVWHLGLMLILVLFGTFQQLRLLSRLAAGPERFGLIAFDVAIGLSVMVLGVGDAFSSAYQAGSAALAGALIGFRAAPLWVGLVLQGALAAWIVGGHPELSDRTGVVLSVSPLFVVPAGVAAVVVGRVLRKRLLAEVDDAMSEPGGAHRQLQVRIRRTLRLASLAGLALPRNRRGGNGLADQLAAIIARDVAGALQRARRPVRGQRFDHPDEDFDIPLSRLCSEWGKVGRTTVFTELAAIRLPIPVQHDLALIVDAALDNVARHAGATRARVTLAEQRDGLLLAIEDNGSGFALPSSESGLRSGDYDGLSGMARRATGIGATFSVTSEPYSGTMISIRIPRRVR